MQIRYGFRLAIDCPQPTPTLLMLDIHPSRAGDIVSAAPFTVLPNVPVDIYADQFGNTVRRLTAPAGRSEFVHEGIIHDSGRPDDVNWDAPQTPFAELPDDALVYLMGSRYCETDRLSADAWNLFGNTPEGWPRVQAIVDFVHNHLTFSYPNARSTRTAFDAYQERSGVCRDFAHLSITFCRAMNIPARYCTGYLGDIGVPRDPAPMDFSAWFEVYLGGRWYTFDARHNKPRIGRVVMARGRDATDVALCSTFGPHTLAVFEVLTDEIGEPVAAAA